MATILACLAAVAVAGAPATAPPAAAPAPSGTILTRAPLRFDPGTASGADALHTTTGVVGGRRVTRTEFRHLDAVTLERVTYVSEGLRVAGVLARPTRAGTYPALLVLRGGNGDFGAIDDRFVLGLARMASWGYVVAATQYRGVDGGDGADELGGADVEDVLSLLALVDREPGADPTRLGIIGFSRGGMETYQVLARTERFRAAVVVGGFTDAAALLEARPELEAVFRARVPRFDEERAAALESRSPARWAGQLARRTPILILHGASDEAVDPRHALEMARGLLARDHPFRLVLLEGGDHALTGHREEVERLVRSWLDRHVTGAGAPRPRAGEEAR